MKEDINNVRADEACCTCYEDIPVGGISEWNWIHGRLTYEISIFESLNFLGAVLIVFKGLGLWVVSSVKEVSSLVISDVCLEGASRQFHARNTISKLIYDWRSPKQGIGHNVLIRKDGVRKFFGVLERDVSAYTRQILIPLLTSMAAPCDETVITP